MWSDRANPRLLAALLLAGCAGTPTAPTRPAGAAVTVAPIVQAGAPGLRRRAIEVPPEQIGTPEFQGLVRTMIATMRDAPGVGLAAPQIGVPWRVIVLEDPPGFVARLTPVEREERERIAFPVRVFVNPVLRAVGDDRVLFFEGCLSVEGYAGLVERSRQVEVSGLDELGRPQSWRVSGWPARILQHEVDHLDGALYVDRMETRSFGTAAQVKALYGGRPIAEIRSMLGL